MFRTAITGRKPTRYINVSVYFVHINVGKVACNCKQSDRLRHDVQRSEFVWSQLRPNHVSRYVTRGGVPFLGYHNLHQSRTWNITGNVRRALWVM